MALRFGLSFGITAAERALAWFGSLLDRHSRSLRRYKPASLRFPHLGIVAHLSLAFAVVATLAVAANMFAEHGTLVIQTSEISPALPLQRVRASQPVTLPAPPVQAAPPPPPPVVRPVSPDALTFAIERYAHSALVRLDDASAEQVFEIGRAAEEVRKETAAYHAQASGIISRAALRSLTEMVLTHEEQAQTLIRLSDSRKTLRQEYVDRFNRLDARVKASVDRAWKIFGRIVARQSLIDVSREVDEMRRVIGRFDAPGGYDPTAVASMEQMEAALAASLQENERGLINSQGEEWVLAMREDLDVLIASRQGLLHNDEQRRQLTSGFAGATTDLVAFVRIVLQPRALAPRQVAKPVASAKLAMGSQAVTGSRYISRGPPQRSVGKPQRTRIVTTTSAPVTDNKERLVWVSIAVLLLLLILSAAMAVRIVGPVRRLMIATRKLADGQTETRVPRGGIKELDSLAVSFNQMAERLALAQAITQEYQGSLEKKVEERTRQLQHLAEHDPLTELPNRRQLFSQLGHAIRTAAEADHLVGVYFLDLDNFKNINDSMGHAFGDRLLQAIAQRLGEFCKAFGFSARLGGDEFTVVYERAASIDEIRTAGWDLVRAFQQPLCVDGRELLMSMSIGASYYPEHGREPEALLRAADAALFRAKALGRSQLSIFSPELLEAASTRFSTEQGLRRALERGDFELAFQPEVHCESLEVGLVEALLRWRLPDGRYASPGDFLAIAEESGLIMEISDWVLRSAIEAASQWCRTGWPKARVAVNVSSRQLLDGQFVERVQTLLREHDLPARCLEIELTENVLQTGGATIDALRRLRAYGIGIALDDFGTGYSTLASLEQLPLTRVKLDRSLVASIDSSERSTAIAQAIIGLCRSLGLEMTAEGIERPEQLHLLLRERAMYLQGYLLSRPVSATDTLSLVKELPARMQSLILTLSENRDEPKSERKASFRAVSARAKR